jgi:hypothetical protein
MWRLRVMGLPDGYPTVATAATPMAARRLPDGNPDGYPTAAATEPDGYRDGCPDGGCDGGRAAGCHR